VDVFGCRGNEDVNSDTTKDNGIGTNDTNKGSNGRLVAIAVGMSCGVALVLVAVAFFRRMHRSRAAKQKFDAAVRSIIN
jgi:hypothetical protein